MAQQWGGKPHPEPKMLDPASAEVGGKQAGEAAKQRE
jgi:hypothetical protein